MPLFLHMLAFISSFHFHASFPTIFSSIFLSLVWGIWTPSKHGPWLRIFQSHIIRPLISFHHSFHPPTHVAFPPFSMPWLSLVIGVNPFYFKFIQSIHFSSNLIIFPSSNHFIHIISIINSFYIYLHIP